LGFLAWKYTIWSSSHKKVSYISIEFHALVGSSIPTYLAHKMILFEKRDRFRLDYSQSLNEPMNVFKKLYSLLIENSLKLINQDTFNFIDRSQWASQDNIFFQS
jgi:hypothetical protein